MCNKNFSGKLYNPVFYGVDKNTGMLDYDDIERIANLKEKMSSVEWNPETIHDSFYELQESYKIPAKEYFRIMYLILLGKERGPRLGFFLATISRDFVVKRLESY